MLCTHKVVAVAISCLEGFLLIGKRTIHIVLTLLLTPRHTNRTLFHTYPRICVYCTSTIILQSYSLRRQTSLRVARLYDPEPRYIRWFLLHLLGPLEATILDSKRSLGCLSIRFTAHGIRFRVTGERWKI